MENNSLNPVRVGESVPFNCTCCGECCTGGMKIPLNLYDLYKLARAQEMGGSRELFDRGVVLPFEGQQGVVVPRMNFKKRPFAFCPFMENSMGEDGGLLGLCRLHLRRKPLVCQLAPIAREVDLETGRVEYSFIPPFPGCPGAKSEGRIVIRELEEELADELAFEVRFFRILEGLKSRGWTADQFVEHLYSFDVTTGFEDILREKESLPVKEIL